MGDNKSMGTAAKSLIDTAFDPITWGEAAVLIVLAAMGFGLIAFVCVLGGAGRDMALAYFSRCMRCGVASAMLVALTHGTLVAWRRNTRVVQRRPRLGRRG